MSKRRPRKQRRKAVSNRDVAALLSYGPQYLPYTAAWTDNRIEQVRHFRHWVYIAIDTIASVVASKLPNVSRVVRGKAPSSSDKAYTRKALTPLLRNEYLKPIPDNHPLPRLLQDPNEPDVSHDFWYETIMFLLLVGSSYWWMPFHKKLKLPEAIWTVPSHWMWPIVGGDKIIDAWEIRPVEGNYLKKLLPAEEVIHFRKKNPISKIDGHSPQTSGAQWIDVQESMNKSMYHTYRNGTFPTVAVQFDGSLQDPTSEQLRRIEEKFLTRYGRELNSNRPLFLPPGVKVNPLQIKANEMVFGDTSERTRDNILALFRVPAVVAGISSQMTHASVSAAYQIFFTSTINPLCRFLGQVATEKLARLYDEDLRIWWEDFTPDDPQQQDRDMKLALMAGAITPNEIRISQGREPWPEAWADEPIKPVNMESLTLPRGGEHADPDSQLPKEPTPQS